MSRLGTFESFGCLNKNKGIFIFSLMVGLYKKQNPLMLATLPFAFMFSVRSLKVRDLGPQKHYSCSVLAKKTEGASPTYRHSRLVTCHCFDKSKCFGGSRPDIVNPALIKSAQGSAFIGWDKPPVAPERVRKRKKE